MRILFIYRSKELGPSIRRVFEPIEQQLRKTEDVDSIYLPFATASPLDTLNNIHYVDAYLKGRRYDVIHITGHAHYLAWSLRKYNTIVTVHDLGFYTNNRQRKFRSWLLYHLFIKPLKYSKAISFISAKSMNETLSVVNLDGIKKSVIPNAVDTKIRFVQRQFNNVRPRILQIGTKPNKNLDRTIKALEEINCHLHIVGPLSDCLLELLQTNGIDYSCSDKLTDEEIGNEYEKCDIVSFPSLYEGFGMSIIEGQAAGRVVVTSNISPMKEIAGDGAILVTPTSIESIKEGFCKAIDMHDYYVKRGFENVGNYDVNRIAKKYLKLYQSI